MHNSTTCYEHKTKQPAKHTHTLWHRVHWQVLTKIEWFGILYLVFTCECEHTKKLSLYNVLPIPSSAARSFQLKNGKKTAFGVSLIENRFDGCAPFDARALKCNQHKNTLQQRVSLCFVVWPSLGPLERRWRREERERMSGKSSKWTIHTNTTQLIVAFQHLNHVRHH